MSMFNCPICGKQNSIEKYHPETFDDGVNIFHNSGLGYRKGFEKIEGYDFEAFPELKEKLGKRIQRISRSLNVTSEPELIAMLEQKVEESNIARVQVEEELEELDLNYLIMKIENQLGKKYSTIHSAVDELIQNNANLQKSQGHAVSTNQNLIANNQRLELEKRNLGSIIERLKTENKNALSINQQWVNANIILETQIQQQSVLIEDERTRRVQLVEYVEELDLDHLLGQIQEYIGSVQNIHHGVAEMIRIINMKNIETYNVLEYINNLLPDEYDILDDLGGAVAAMYQYYEDRIEELSCS